ncbi:MAG: VOC family protein, partial [Maritimibacter sp.]|nr:VOC family protein [Maritimibacter sp.]
MIGYITVGSNDLAKAAGFFDPLLATLGGSRAYTLDHQIAWGFGEGRPMLVVTRPYDGGPAGPGNGTMVALRAASEAQVDETHALALTLGATDEGAPGARGKHFYGGYFRDPDGN